MLKQMITDAINKLLKSKLNKECIGWIGRFIERITFRVISHDCKKTTTWNK
jgi:hypothetical protein